MRNLYLGTSDFAAAILERLADSSHRPELVITRPDRPKGRGRKLLAPPVAVRGRELGFEVLQPEKLHAPEVLERIQAFKPGALIVCAYGVLIKEPLLSDYEMVNVHPSLLPRWRGAAPIERAIMAGDRQTGLSIMRITEGLDSGPVYLQAPEEIRPDDDYGTLSQRLQQLGAKLLIQALDDLPKPKQQTKSDATYADKITATDRSLDFTRTPAELERTVRALRPHIGARLGPYSNSAFLGVTSARVADEFQSRKPGWVHQEGDQLLLDCNEGSLQLLEVQPPGGKPMPTREWLRGRPDPAFINVELLTPVGN